MKSAENKCEEEILKIFKKFKIYFLKLFVF